MSIKFSIIIPTYNEENDIAGTLEALLSLDYFDKEILVVDDSTDRTPEIVRSYALQGVRLIHPGGGGRCEARNLGIQEATGEIVCILNADVRPRADFLSRLTGHYNSGADYVLVAARISNQENLFARYVGCVSDFEYNENTDPNQMEWTEGFSCRKEVAIKAGLFPVGFAVPICAGEDGFFGIGLRKSGARKVIDFSIVVDHVAPSRLVEYWRIRRGRGEGSAQVHRFLEKWPYPRLVLWNLLKTGRSLAYFILIIPALLFCWNATRYSPNKYKDCLPFFFAWSIERIAFHVGEWQMTFRMYAKENARAASR